MIRRFELKRPLDPGPEAQPALSAGQKKFNGLIRKIESQRQLLADWQQAVPLVQQRYASEFEPLLESCQTLHRELVQFLDAAHDRKGLSKAERQTLRELICEMAASLMGSADHEVMKAIYNRHSTIDFDTEQAQATQALRSMMEESLGLDPNDAAELESPDDLLQRLQEQVQAEQARRAEQREQRRAKRKLSAKQLQQQQEQQQAGQSTREIYRKLVSALHPDRESDPQERERKTALMQRVNQAYAGNKLLDMLQLQLEIEQIDAQHIQTLSEARLKHYNQVLAEQLAELQTETQGYEQGFRQQFGLRPDDPVTPAKLMGTLRNQMQRLQYDIHHLRLERQTLDDMQNLRRWLKAQRRPADAYDGFPDLLFGVRQ